MRIAHASSVLISLLAVIAPVCGGNVDLPRFPSINPDGSQIVFSWRGDLWKAASSGGHATRLTSHPANETLSAWSRDGSQIAFMSTRDGFNNIYVMNADGSEIRQVTNIDATCVLAGWGEDEDGNEVLTFHGLLEPDVYREHRPFMISEDGGDILRMHDAFGSQPRTSADGRYVSFARGGYYYGWQRRHGRGPESQEVWLYDRQGDSFTQLTEWDGHDGHAKWAGARSLIYMSDREDNTVNLYQLPINSGDANAMAITNFQNQDVQSFDVSADGSTAVMHVWDALYTLDLRAGNAQPRKLDLSASEDESDNYEIKSVDREVSDAELSPDGQVMAFIAYGDVYVRNLDDKSPTRPVTQTVHHERDVTWSPDGLHLYFVSDEDGTNSIYRASVTRTRSEIKKEFEKITNPPDEEADDAHSDDDDEPDDEIEDDEENAADDGLSGTWSGSAAMPEVGDMPFTMTLSVDDDGTVSGSLESDAANGELSGTFNAASGVLELTVETSDGGVGTMSASVTNGSMVGTADVGGMIVEFTADRTSDNGDEQTQDDDTGKKKKKKDVPPEYDPDRWHDAMTFAIEPVVQTAFNDRSPSLSPDGTKLALRRTRGDIIVVDLESGVETAVTRSWDTGTEWDWAPDSAHLVYDQSDMDFNSDIFIQPIDGSWPRVNITKHPDNDGRPRFSADGKIVSFVSERINEEMDVWMVFLDPDLEALTSKELDEYFEDARKAAKKRKPLEIEVPETEGEDVAEEDVDEDDESDDDEEDQDEEIELNWDLDKAYLRLRRVTRLSGNESGALITPAGDRIVFNGNSGGRGLFSVKWDGTDRKRLGGPVNPVHMTLSGDKVVFTSGGRAGHVGTGGGSVEYVNIDHSIRIDLQQQAEQKFLEMARTIGEEFYHPTMKGLDWDALTREYLELAKRTRTVDEFNDVGNRFLGELTASHMGVRSVGAYSSPNRQSHGRLGATYTRTSEGFRVDSIIPESPASKGPMALEVGDVITAIEGEPFGPTDSVVTRLEGRSGEETLFSVRRTINTDGELQDVELPILLTPTSYGAIRQLAYTAWRNETAEQVDAMSGGRLGYIHIQGMSQPSLDVFERDLFAAAEGKDGLVIDVRNNGGGWTTDRLLSSIMVVPHAYTIPRGADPNDRGHYPQDRLFIQRYSLPMNLLCNEKSFSNAEIMSHAFKTLNRGTLVGQETWGGVISTGGFQLIDGTFVRLPFRGWYVADGTNADMENYGAVPDIIVEQTPAAEAAGRDEQLEAAVRDLMQRLP